MSKRKTRKKKRAPARKRKATRKPARKKKRRPSFTTKGIPWPEPKRLIVVVR